MVGVICKNDKMLVFFFRLYLKVFLFGLIVSDFNQVAFITVPIPQIWNGAM